MINPLFSTLSEDFIDNLWRAISTHNFMVFKFRFVKLFNAVILLQPRPQFQYIFLNFPFLYSLQTSSTLPVFSVLY